MRAIRARHAVRRDGIDFVKGIMAGKSENKRKTDESTITMPL